MAKLYFRYGSMGCGKSLDLLKCVHNYEERNQNVLIFTSAIDDRYGTNKVKSRIGVERDAIPVKKDTNIYSIFEKEQELKEIACVFVDEVQFFNTQQIDQLAQIVDNCSTPVICYGLRSDFMLNGFEGSIRLLSICDTIEEIKNICHCGKKAIINVKVVDGEISTEGEQIEIGGNELYTSLCRKCYKEGKLK